LVHGLPPGVLDGGVQVCGSAGEVAGEMDGVGHVDVQGWAA